MEITNQPAYGADARRPSTTADLIPANPHRYLITLFLGLIAATGFTGWLRRSLDLGTPSILYLSDEPGRQLAALILNSVTWGFRITVFYLALVVAFKAFRVHERYGIFRQPEPESHYWTAIRNWRNPFLWGIGITFLTFLLMLDNQSIEFGGHPRLLLQLPERFVFLHSPNWMTDVLYGVIGFYLIDLTDWTAHRVNHFRVFYSRFPYGHFIHHNHHYLNPFVVTASPTLHFAALTGFIMYGLLLSQGLVAALFLIHLMKVFTNFASHLGCDPMPWLSRLNYKVGGWIPWIPLHHQYHHVPGVRGNYGNLTALWDHVFGTLAPEYIHHVTTSEAVPRVTRLMANEKGAMDRLMRGKTRLSLK